MSTLDGFLRSHLVAAVVSKESRVYQALTAGYPGVTAGFSATSPELLRVKWNGNASKVVLLVKNRSIKAQ